MGGDAAKKPIGTGEKQPLVKSLVEKEEVKTEQGGYFKYNAKCAFALFALLIFINILAFSKGFDNIQLAKVQGACILGLLFCAYVVPVCSRFLCFKQKQTESDTWDEVHDIIMIKDKERP